MPGFEIDLSRSKLYVSINAGSHINWIEMSQNDIETKVCVWKDKGKYNLCIGRNMQSLYASSVESVRSYEKQTLFLEVSNFPQNTDPATTPTPHEVRRAQHQAQHSFLGSASGPAVCSFSVRLLLLSPA